jgi:hypothetical protein
MPAHIMIFDKTYVSCRLREAMSCPALRDDMKCADLRDEVTIYLKADLRRKNCEKWGVELRFRRG